MSMSTNPADYREGKTPDLLGPEAMGRFVCHPSETAYGRVCRCASMTVEQARAIIAKAVIAEAIRDQYEDKWEDHPNVGQDDWDAIVQEVESLTPDVSTADYETAYALLKDRADEWERENDAPF